MNAAVLADRGPLYALADPSDQFHARTESELRVIQRQNSNVLVSYATLCESHTLILRRLGGAYAQEWLTEVLDGAILVNPEPADYLLAAAQLERFTDHQITLVDAITAVLSGRLEVPIWSFDRHFATLRAKIWRYDTT